MSYRDGLCETNNQLLVFSDDVFTRGHLRRAVAQVSTETR